MRLALTLILILTILSACADLNPEKPHDRTDSLSLGERKALYEEALEGARRSRERYIATTRPTLQLQFRQEYPTMAEADIEVLAQAFLQRIIHQETGRRTDRPIRQPQMDCMSSPWRTSVYSNCY